MRQKFEEHYNLSDDLPTIIASADRSEKPLLSTSKVDELSTETSRLEVDTPTVLPESPWYLVTVMVVFVGVLAGVLFLQW